MRQIPRSFQQRSRGFGACPRANHFVLNAKIEVRMKLTGHSSKPVHHGYTHLELDALKTAIAALDQKP
jgi:hypothetical protein